MNQMLKLGGENISNMTGVLNLDPTHDDIEVGIRVRFLLGIRILRYGQHFFNYHSPFSTMVIW